MKQEVFRKKWKAFFRRYISLLYALFWLFLCMLFTYTKSTSLLSGLKYILLVLFILFSLGVFFIKKHFLRILASLCVIIVVGLVFCKYDDVLNTMHNGIQTSFYTLLAFTAYAWLIFLLEKQGKPYSFSSSQLLKIIHEECNDIQEENAAFLSNYYQKQAVETLSSGKTGRFKYQSVLIRRKQINRSFYILLSITLASFVCIFATNSSQKCNTLTEIFGGIFGAALSVTLSLADYIDSLDPKEKTLAKTE